MFYRSRCKLTNVGPYRSGQAGPVFAVGTTTLALRAASCRLMPSAACSCDGKQPIDGGLHQA